MRKFKIWGTLLFFMMLICSMPIIFADDQTTNTGAIQPSFYVPRQLTQMSKKNSFITYSQAPYIEKYILPNISTLPIRNQGSFGVCWTFSALATFEYNLLKNNDLRDFSEQNMAYGTSYLPIDMPYDLNYINNNNIVPYTTPDHGGNRNMALGYLLRGDGPVNETDDPYGSLNVYANHQYSDVVKRIKQSYITETKFIPDMIYNTDSTATTMNIDRTSFISSIKKAISTEQSAVATAIYMDKSYMNFIDNKSYYFYNATNNNNYMGVLYPHVSHAVTIVGWDDNISKANFKSAPAGDGAFIVRNSWGASGNAEGMSGYFYISYYDYNIGLDSYYITKTVPPYTYDSIYQYDYDGLDGCYGSYSNENGTAYPINAYSNIFVRKDTSKKETLSAVGIYALCGFEYTLYVNNNPADNDPGNVDQLTKLKTGTISEPGFYVIDVPKTLLTSNKYSVVVEISNPTNGNFIFPVDFNADAIEGKSFTSARNQADNILYWYDSYNNYDKSYNCLKAYTVSDEGGAIISDPKGTGMGDYIENINNLTDIRITEWNRAISASNTLLEFVDSKNELLKIYFVPKKDTNGLWASQITVPKLNNNPKILVWQDLFTIKPVKNYFMAK